MYLLTSLLIFTITMPWPSLPLTAPSLGHVQAGYGKRLMYKHFNDRERETERRVQLGELYYYYYYYYYYYTIRMSLVTGLFFLVLLLNQRWSPPLRLQASHCSTFRIMCDVPSIAVFCSGSIECFPGTVSKFFFKLLVTIPLAPIITGTIVHFRFHICCISIHKL